MAGLGPVGMIFVPSAGGRSHCPEEWTDAGQVAAGAAVLAETLRLADQGNPSGTGRDG
jgi:N-carbamoyl-L-amino-acid hydrolase